MGLQGVGHDLVTYKQQQQGEFSKHEECELNTEILVELLYSNKGNFKQVTILNRKKSIKYIRIYLIKVVKIL